VIVAGSSSESDEHVEEEIQVQIEEHLPEDSSDFTDAIYFDNREE